MREQLAEQIKYHNKRYFLDNDPEISDDQYDELKRQYDALGGNKSSSPVLLDMEGSALHKVGLDIPMLSLSKKLNLSEYEAWESDYEDKDKYHSYKLDGLAIEACYEFGLLTKLRTRGDGLTGEDILDNAGVFSPDQLPLENPALKDFHRVWLRGEGYVRLDDLVVINEINAKSYPNCRSAASGLIRRNPKDNVDLAGKISYNVYWCSERFGLETYSAVMDKLRDFGFSTAPECQYEDIVNNNRPPLLPTDGIVSVIDSFSDQDELGSTNEYPRWGVAYKFPPEQAETIAENVSWETGRTGRVTPVLTYKAVTLGGNTNTECSLFNYRHFIKTGVRKGSRIIIARNGDVIPYFVKVVEAGLGDEFKTPKVCPSCSSILMYEGKDEKNIFLTCKNTVDCPAQHIQRFINFVSRKGLDIKGYGDKMMEKHVGEGKVSTLSDILNLGEILSGEGLDRNTEKVIEKLNNLGSYQAYKVLGALGVPGVAEGTAKLITAQVGSVEDLIALLKDVKRLLEIEGVGVSTVNEIQSFLSNPALLTDVENVLNKLTLTFEKGQEHDIKVCVTGGLSIPRKAAEEKFNLSGIELLDGVTKKMDVLVFAPGGSQGKKDKAIAMNKVVIEATDVHTVEQIIDQILTAI